MENLSQAKSILIKPLHRPEIKNISGGCQGLFEIIDIINQDKDGNPFPYRYSFDIIQITKKLHVFVRENSEDGTLPLNRTIGHVNLYGTIVLAYCDDECDIIPMTDEDVAYYCGLFSNEKISIDAFEDLLRI